MTNPPDHVDVVRAARRVAEYVRQRDIAMSGGNVGDVITTICADPEVDPAHLDVNDLRLLLAAVQVDQDGADAFDHTQQCQASQEGTQWRHTLEP